MANIIEHYKEMVCAKKKNPLRLNETLDAINLWLKQFHFRHEEISIAKWKVIKVRNLR